MTRLVEFQDQLVLHIHPQYLNAQIGEHVRGLLHARLENKWSELHGFVTDVKMLPLNGAGRINAKTGYTEITVKYKAMSCKPVVGKSLSAQVVLVTKLGIHFVSGPLKMFMHEKMLPSSYSFIDDNFHCSITNTNIKRDDQINVKIVGTSWTDGEYMAIVTLA